MNDVVALITRLHRERRLHDFILFGHSYGSVPATRVAHALETLHRSNPRSPLPTHLVLQGAIGRAFTQPSERTDVLNQLLTRVQSQGPFALGSGDAWGHFVGLSLIDDNPGASALTTAGQTPTSPVGTLRDSPSARLVSWLKRMGTPEFERQFSRLGHAGNRAQPVTDSVRHRLACRELGLEPTRITLEGGRLREISLGACGNTLRQEPYDARRYPLKTPIVYFLGGEDARTPRSQAEYHFGAQTGARRLLIEIPHAGHQPLTLGLWDCRAKVWEAVSQSRLARVEALAARCAPTLRSWYANASRDR